MLRLNPQGAQRNLLLLEKLYPGTTNNHRSVVVEIDGPLDLSVLKKALDYVITRHEMLRAAVRKQANFIFHITPVKECYETKDSNEMVIWPIKFIDASTRVSIPPPIEDLYKTLKLLNEEKCIEEAFNLKDGPLWRSTLVKIEDNKHQFLMIFNHIIVDEGSIGIIFNDLSACYNALLKNTLPALQPIPSLEDIQFDLTKDEVKRRLEEYWQKELANLNICNIQTDFPLERSLRFAGKRKAFLLNSTLISKLESQPQLKGSLNPIFLAALYSLLYRYTGETDICIGITSSNRRYTGVDPEQMKLLVNCFFNSIPLRLDFSQYPHFNEILDRVKVSLKMVLTNQLPLDVLFQDALSEETKSSLSSASPFDFMLVFNEKKPTLEFTNTTATYPIELDLGHSKFPLAINIDKYPDGSCHCFIEFGDLFNEETIQRISEHFCKILEVIANDPHCKISTIPLLLDEEKKLIESFNANDKPNGSLLVPEFFHQKANNQPKDDFIVFHHEFALPERLTYSQVDFRTTQLSNYLQKLGIGPNVKVGISVHRSPNLIIALFAVLKAGGVVVALETEETPMLAYKIKNADVQLIIVDQQTHLLFEKSNKPLLNLQDEQIVQTLTECEYVYHAPSLTPQHPAYIMYSSGTTTPFPKGVIISHAGFANLLYSLHYDFDLNPDTKTIGTALPTFDAFWWEILAALAAKKGQFHFCFEKGRFSSGKIIRNEQITFGAFLPEHLATLDPDSSLIDVTTMGAAPDKDNLKKWEREGRRIRNGYGPTEACVCATHQLYLPSSNHNLIGQPIRNTKIFILNPENYSLCPMGVPGEMYIAGPGVAIGYVGNEELTNEKFLHMVFDASEGVFKKCETNTAEQKTIRLYATGDYACYQFINGQLTLDLIGRRDREFKFHGVRVSLDAVEAVLRNHPIIKNVVLVPTLDHTTLTAYVIPSSDEITDKEINDQLLQYLPTTLLPPVAYPRNIVKLTQFPLSPNGKIDLRALPSPAPLQNFSLLESLTPLQKEVRKIWAELLKKPEDNISIYHSYKYLGGNSLSLVVMESELIRKCILPSETEVDLLSTLMTITSFCKNLQLYVNSQPAQGRVGLDTILIDVQQEPSPEPVQIWLGPQTYLIDDTIVFFKTKNTRTTDPSPTITPPTRSPNPSKTE